jgi:pimeloyl-ACP methyl ester carboxylesterase
MLGVGACGVGLVRADLPAAELEARHAPPPSQFLELPSGARVHYRDEGPREAPVLVLLHGSNASLHTWEGWVARLKDGWRVVTLDLPGHGLTGPVPGDDYSVPGVLAFLDEFTRALGLEHFHLGGNSYGGMLSWRYALAHPERVDTLILVDAAGYPSPSPLVFRVARLPVVGRLMEWITPRQVVEANLRQVYFDASRLTPEQVERYHALLLREGNRRATRLRLSSPMDVLAGPETLSGLRVPTLVLWGEEDAWIPVEHGRSFARDIPGARLRVYPRAGHIPMEEIPEETAAEVRAFLEEQAAVPSGE